MKSSIGAFAFFSIALTVSGCNDAPATGGANKSAASEAAALATGEVTDADKVAAETVIRTIYDSYKTQDTTPASDARPVFSVELTRMIAGLPRPEGMVGPLQDADWFCGCQDWDGANARVTELTSAVGADGKIVITSHFMPGLTGDPVVITYQMAKEDGQWKIDDMTNSSGDFSLRRDIANAVSEATAS